MVDFVELSNKRYNSVRTIEELVVEFITLFSKISAESQSAFVEILTTTYIF